jgi:hypothetical protein
MATNLQGYTEQEVLNKVLNTSSDSLKVDIVSGAEYAEDSSHTHEDTGNFVLGVRNDVLAELGGDDGDYVPFQMNADGALYVEVSSGGSTDAVYVDDANWIDGSSKHMLVGGLYQSTPQSITDGDVGPFQVDADGALHISDGGNTITVDGTVTANLGSTDNTVLDNIDSNTDYGATTGGGTESGALRVTIANNSTGVVSVDDNGSTLTVDVASGGIASGAIASGAVASGAIASGAVASGAIASGALASGSVVDGAMVTLGAKADAKNSATDTTSVSAMQVLKQISASVQEVATDTGTIDSDTDATKTATEASQAALEKMLYGNALVVTAVDGGSTQALGATYESLYVGVGGNVVVTMVGTGNFTFSNVASGQLLPIRITHVINTGTTATNMIALKA